MIPSIGQIKSSGWIPDPPGKDWNFKDSLSSFVLAPGDVDLAPWCTDVSDQFHLSSCVANAMADAFELCTGLELAQEAAKASGISDAVTAGLTLAKIQKKPEQISRLQIYFNGRSRMTEDGVHNLTNEDKGMYIRAAFDACRILGVCPESMWEYSTKNVNRRPPVASTFYALKHKMKSYYRISDDPDESLELMKKALRGRHPVVFSIPVNETFRTWSSSAVIPAPKSGDDFIGRHAIMAVGVYGDNIKIRNSWGIDWGKNGYATLHPEWFTKGHAVSMFIPTKGVMFK